MHVSNFIRLFLLIVRTFLTRYTEMECANYCGILHSSTSAATDASFFHFKRHTTNNSSPVCTCMINIPTDATDAYGSDVLFVAGQSSLCLVDFSLILEAKIKSSMKNDLGVALTEVVN